MYNLNGRLQGRKRIINYVGTEKMTIALIQLYM